jgi:divalent metal cation (Fe/Co/Zn/Cd) transporter
VVTAGFVGNQAVARYKLVVGRRIRLGTLIGDAKHPWLDALSSAGAPLGLLGGLLGARWADPVAGLAMTLFIFHVGWEVTGDAANRHMDGVGPEVITTAEAAVSCLPRIRHVHARARGPAGRCASGSKLGSTRRSPSVRPTPSGSPQPPRSSKRSRTLDL